MLTAVVSVAAVAGAVSVAPASARTPLALGTGVAAAVVVAAVFLTVHARQSARIALRALQTATHEAERLVGERERIREQAQRERLHLIDEMARQHSEFSDSLADERARAQDAGARETEHLRHDNARLADELARAIRAREAALSATSSAAARMQALTTAMLADLRAMEERHSDEEVLADLLHLDHRTAQAGRLADSVAVLTGARSGRRWARPIPMESILRGALGRISAYRRVRIHTVSDTAVAGHAAEGVMHALAELLDNAANFSPPTSEVHVYVEEVPTGVIVSVEDSGLVMGEVQLRRAKQAVSGEVSGLGGLTGTRLGLAVVGRLARKYGLEVSFRPSARGGTGVLMRLPQDLLTTPAAPERHVSPPGQNHGRNAEEGGRAPAPEPPARERGTGAGPEPEHESVPDGTSGDTAGPAAGLPRRRRGRTLAAAERARAATRTAAPRESSGTDGTEARVARFSNFRQAVRGTASGGAAEPDATSPRQAAEDGATAPADPAGSASHSNAHLEGNTS
jgi:signal transduction histidine kinase